MKHLVLGTLVSLTLAFQGAMSAVPPGNRFVDNVGTCLGLTPCHATVSEAVAAAAPFDRIRIFPGVYHESVVIVQEKTDIVLQPFYADRRPVIAAPSGTALALYAARAQVRGLRLESPDGPGLYVLDNSDLGDVVVDAVIDGNVVDAPEGVRGGWWWRMKFTRNFVSAGGVRLGGDLRSCLFEGNIIHGRLSGEGYSAKAWNIVRGNVVIGGDLEFTGDAVGENLIESNRIEGGNLHLEGSDLNGVMRNQVRRNVIRGGGLWIELHSWPFEDNVVELNFVSGSPGDGIALINGAGGNTIVRNNTSVDNAGCDLSDNAWDQGTRFNTWSGNRFRTKCGAATG